MPKEAEASEKMSAEEINVNRLVRELLEREQWKSVFRGRKALPVSEGQMQEFCDALEILKVEREIELDDYAEAYYEIDDVSVSEAVYDAKWRELERDEYISIGYRDAVFVDDILELKSLLAQEIEGIEEENFKDMK